MYTNANTKAKASIKLLSLSQLHTNSLSLLQGTRPWFQPKIMPVNGFSQTINPRRPLHSSATIKPRPKLFPAIMAFCVGAMESCG